MDVLRGQENREEGSVLLEYALVVPIVMLLLLGTIELLAYAGTKAGLTALSFEAARSVAVNRDSAGDSLRLVTEHEWGPPGMQAGWPSAEVEQGAGLVRVRVSQPYRGVLLPGLFDAWRPMVGAGMAAF